MHRGKAGRGSHERQPPHQELRVLTAEERLAALTCDPDDVLFVGTGCPAASGQYGGGYETAQDQRQRLRASEAAMEQAYLPPGGMSFTPYPGHVEPRFE
jgi:hypothetical protein